MKIKFTDREQFEKSTDIVFGANTRLNSAGDLTVGYFAMTYTFEDKHHGKRAVERLKAKNIACFTVDESDTIGA